MQTLKKGPRLSREGWVPANPPRSRKSNMAIPKTNRAGAPYGVDPEWQVGKVLTEMTPAERHALDYIVNNLDLIETDDGRTYLFVRAWPLLMDRLATVGAEREDLEDGGDYERTDPAPDSSQWYGLDKPTDASDDEPDHDRELEEGVF